MIFSRSSQYAIQALVFLATQPSSDYVMCREMAGRLGLPLPYLSKLMLQFVNADIVESSRGRQGGFRLSRDANQLFLMEIVEVIGGERRMKECLLGLKECSEETACAMHCQWYPVKQELLQLLEQQSVGALAAAAEHGEYKLTELNLDSLLPLPGGDRE
jgi:Rrf2 family transcriptional regulator, iron-sulfur cluster assembly transcription factor